MAEPTKPRHVDFSHASMKQKHRNKDKHRDRSLYSGKHEKSKESLDKLIQDHLYAKQQKEER